MATKGYMNDFEALRKQYDFTVKSNRDSTAWNLYRGFLDTYNDRRGILYRQDNEDMSVEESFELLEQLIRDNSAGGGDFTIYFPKKGAGNHQHGSIFFKVERGGMPQAAGLGGFQDIRLSGYLTPQDLERERELWELRRETEDLKAAIGAPQNIGQQVLQSMLEDGTIKQIAGQVLGILNGVIAGFMNKNQPMVSIQGINGQPVIPNQPIASDHTAQDGVDYPDAMYDFADYIIQQIGDDPAIQQKFWTNLKTQAIQNPILIQQLLL